MVGFPSVVENLHISEKSPKSSSFNVIFVIFVTLKYTKSFALPYNVNLH